MWARLKKKLDGWRTIIWNGFLGVTPVALVALDKFASVDLTQYMTWWLAILVGFVVSAIGVWLRYITTGPIGAKGGETPEYELKGGD